MKAVQTLWTCNKDPLKDGFGWRTPEHNLMAWALSCLCLKENYDEVVLYTDSVGYAILIEKLQLPYTDVVIAYDNFYCQEALWALCKLKTYYVQEAPFIHVDADVFLRERLTPEVENAPLIVQNRERGTAYYKGFMNVIKDEIRISPKGLKEEIGKESISSYNAGVLGGNNLEFVKEYCETAFKFIEENGLNENKAVSMNYNILFEQILLYVLSAQRPDIKVGTVIDDIINDNGYMYDRFCNFSTFFTTKPYMHIIGAGHKQNEHTCRMLKSTLHTAYPDYFFRIMDLFPRTERWKGYYTLSKETGQYELFKQQTFEEWNKTTDQQFKSFYAHTVDYNSFLSFSRKEQNPVILKRNPSLAIYEDARQWSEVKKHLFKQTCRKGFNKDTFDVVLVPDPFFDTFQEVPVDDWCYNILMVLKRETSFQKLLKSLHSSVSDPEISKKRKLFYTMILSRLRYLFENKLISIEP